MKAVGSSHRPLSGNEVGNRLTKSDAGSRTTYGYDQADQLLRVGPWGSYVYPTVWSSDENGNLTVENYVGNKTTFSWDTEDRLVKVVQPSGYTEENSYSADGLRRSRLAGTSRYTYLWDEDVLLRDYGIYTTLPGAPGGLLAAKVGAAHMFYVPDMQGHVRQVTDINGGIIAAYLYDAWGLVADTNQTAMAFGDWGYTWDGKPGRYYVQQRHLRADLGRWMSVDPVETEPRYLYVGDRPTWAVDPSGEQGFGEVQWLRAGDYEYERALGARSIRNLDEAIRPPGPVAQMTLAAKLGAAIKRSRNYLTAEAYDQVASLASGPNLIILGVTVGAWIAGHAFGVSEVVDVGLLVGGVVLVGWSAIGGFRALYEFATTASTARTDADIDLAARHFARAVTTLGITTLAALLLRGSATAAKGKVQTLVGRVREQGISGIRHTGPRSARPGAGGVRRSSTAGQTGTGTVPGRPQAGEGLAWQNRPPGIQVARGTDGYWYKRANPRASILVRQWAWETMDAQAEGLAKLRAGGSPAATFEWLPNGILKIEDVGPAYSGYGQLTNPAYWRARFRDSRALGTVLNDLKPGNYGEAFIPFDPSLDPIQKAILVGVIAEVLGIAVKVSDGR